MLVPLLSAVALAAEPVPLVLPAGADAVAWAEIAGNVGLFLVPPGDAAWAEVIEAPSGWELRVHGAAGGVRSTPVGPPTTRDASEDVLLLAVSLLRPLSGGDRGWATLPVAPRRWQPLEAELDLPEIPVETPPPWIEGAALVLTGGPPGPAMPLPEVFAVPEPTAWFSVSPTIGLRARLSPTPALGLVLHRDDLLRFRASAVLFAPTALPDGERHLSMARFEAGAAGCLGEGWALCVGGDAGVTSARFLVLVSEDGEEDAERFLGGTLVPRLAARIGVERAIGGAFTVAAEATPAIDLRPTHASRPGQTSNIGLVTFEPSLSVRTRLP